MVSSPTYHMLWRNNFRALKFLAAIFFSCIVNRNNLCSNQQFVSSTVPPSSILPPSLRTLRLDGYLTSEGLDQAAKDFGNITHHLPSAVLHPKSVTDISSTIKRIFEMGTTTELTVAARGHGHSLHGQSQAHRGVVVRMESLRAEMHFHTGELPHVDVSGGELWINILNESLKRGLAPKSWTDYLHLTVGGTLSNAGISGQAFRHGPQINNIYQLEVVTGKGEVITCSEKQNDDLFYGVLGGLGQFGIITRARISLEPAPKMVKWIRVLYSDFSIFTKDQEHLISTEDTFDYIEGFVLINRTGLLSKWRSYSFNPKHPLQASRFNSEGKTLFCLEVAKYFDPDESTDDFVNQQVDRLLSGLGFIQSTLFLSSVSYVEFLDRVHTSELKLREKGLWEVPHPWLNLLIPRSRVHDFAALVFGGILTDTNNGPVIIYPVNKSKWNKRTSVVTPEEDVFYQVAFLSSPVPSSKGADELEHILNRNRRILDLCKSAPLGIKQYLPHYSSQEEWRAHFGPQWDDFARRKSKYDPLAILAPGHQIFKKARALS